VYSVPLWFIKNDIVLIDKIIKRVCGYLSRLNEEEEAIFKAEIDTIGLVEEEQVMEIVTSWMERGINQGIEREFALVLRQVNRRLGGLNPTLEAQIRDLSIEQVEDLGEALLDFQTEADLVNWLNRN
jgi:Domain of unknown function (DUF4351)